MKNKRIITFITPLVCAVSFAQSTAKVLPDFYDTTEDIKVFRCDMESDGMDPVIIYNTYAGNDIKCKTWDGEEWVDYMVVFPEVKNRGFVNLEFHNGDAFALVQDGDYFSMYRMKSDEEVWKLFGTKNFASTKQLTTPEFTFVEDNPVIFEKQYSEGLVHIYKYKDGKITELAAASLLKGEITSDLNIVSNNANKMTLAWTTNRVKSLQVFEITLDNSSGATLVPLTKGLQRKRVRGVKQLMYLLDDLYIVYTDKYWNLKASKLTKGNENWKPIAINETIDGIGYYMADDLSFVTKSRTFELSVFRKFNGAGWSAGIPLKGPTKDPIMEKGKFAALAESLNEYFFLYHDDKGNVKILKTERITK